MQQGLVCVSGDARGNSVRLASTRNDGTLRRLTASASLVALAAVFATVVPKGAKAADECGAEAAGADTISCPAGTYPNGINYTNSDGLTLNLNDAGIIVSQPNVGNPTAVVGVVSSNTNTNDIIINASNFGSVTTSGSFAARRGIMVENNGTAGNAFITMDAGAVTMQVQQTQEALRAAILNSANAGTARVTMNGGSASVGSSFNSRAIHVINAGTGNAEAIVNGGTLLAGNVSLGLIQSEVTNANSQATASVNITNGTLTSAAQGSGAVRALNAGLGAATVTMSGGSLSATAGGYGLEASITNANSESDATVTLSNGTITTTGNALSSVTAGTGTAIVNVSGGSAASTNNNGDGIFARATSAAGTFDVNLTGGTVTGGGGNGAGVHTGALAGGTIDITADATVNAGGSGVAIRDGDLNRDGIDETSGSVVLTTAGIVNGSVLLGGGNDTANVTAGSISGVMDFGSTVAGDDIFNLTGGSLGAGALMGDGADTFNWTTAGAVTGTVDMGAGVDNVMLTSLDAATIGSTILDGGAGADTLNFNNTDSSTSEAAQFLNFENMALTNGSQFTLDGDLALGTDGTSSFSLAGGTTLFAGGGENATITGNALNVINAGTIDLTNGASGATDTLTIAGNYTGTGGTVLIETVLGDDASPTDLLIVEGNTNVGNTFVRVNNLGGTGAQTTEGIKVVDVGGTSDGTFSLLGNAVINGDQALAVGAFAYTLEQGGIADPEDGDWYLRTLGFTPSATAYESYPGVLLGLIDMPTMQQRIGNVYMPNAGSATDGYVNPEPTADVAQPEYVPLANFWTRIEAATGHYEGDSDTGTEYDLDRYKVQVGIDGRLGESEDGIFIAGINAQYGHADADLESDTGDGDNSTDSYGGGLTLTWISTSGFYADAQAMVHYLESDLSSDVLGDLVDNNEGWGYGLSLELGRKIALDDTVSLTPQAQLAYTSVDFDDFTDEQGVDVSLDEGESLKGRLGIALGVDGYEAGDSRSHVYAIANVTYEFLDAQSVDIAGVDVEFEPEEFGGELGLGGTYEWDGGKYAIHGEALGQTSFEGSYGVKGNLGFSARF